MNLTIPPHSPSPFPPMKTLHGIYTLSGDPTSSGYKIFSGIRPHSKPTPITPISACHYSELRNAITSYSGVQCLLTKIQ
jgi:hypothetical protein